MTLLSSFRMVAVTSIATGLASLAQSQEALRFDVAAVKPANPDARGTSIGYVPGGGLRMTNYSLKMLITFAYDIRDFQLSGGPGWLNSDRYDILAKPEAPEGPADMGKATDAEFKTLFERTRERLRALLAERFQLAVHRETKEGPVYALLARKNELKLRESKEPTGESIGMSMNSGRVRMTARRVAMPVLATTLSSQLNRPVLDQTGLSGKYDFQIEWNMDLAARTPEAAADSSDSAGPSLFTAIQEQLGLKLEVTRGLVDIIVIDRVEKPSEN